MNLIEINWATITLEELFVHIIGGDWGKEENYEDDNYKIVSCIRGSEFKHWKNDYGSTAVTRKIKLSSFESRCLNNNDILVEISGGGPDQPVGRTVLITQTVLNKLPYPAVCTNFLRLMRPVKNISAAYLNYYLNKFYVSGEVINYQGGSNNLRNLKFKKYSKINIPLPSINEQRIIAEKLDSLLSQVEKTKSHLQKIPETLKQFRQSVLSDAVSGKLTDDWRIKNIKLNSLSWDKMKLAEIGNLCRGKSKHRPRNDPKLFGNEYPFIQTGDVANSNGRIKSATKFYSQFGLSQSKLFNKGTLCITIAANIADTAILDINACFPDSVVGFSHIEDKCNILFIKFLIDNKKSDLNALAPATAQKNINLKVLNDLYLSIPTLKEQNEIVRRVEQLFSYADKIERQANDALERVNNLTQSLLAKAFRGDLTAKWRAENPNLISGENSAKALLEKIKQEKRY